MAGLLKRNTGAAVASVAAAVSDPDSIEAINSEIKELEKNINLKNVVSSGSTLLDLAISGGNTPEGGIPGGMFMEYFGPSGAGKTALLSELAASTQSKGGMVRFCDPEARLDKEYSKIYGVSMDTDFEYYRPDTVASMFTDYIWPWNPPDPNVINMIAADSIAALSTDLEMDNDDGDKMGMRRAKEFSEGLRKTCRLIAKRQWLIAFSNQIRGAGEGEKGTTTPGGHAVPFYASLRIKVAKGYPSWQIKRKMKFKGVDIEKVVGVISECTVVKSSVDEPYRTAPLSVVFGYGIDTIRDELQFYKSMTKESSYNCIDKMIGSSIEDACRYIEQNHLERKLKLRTTGLWNEIQAMFKKNQRLPKAR